MGSITNRSFPIFLLLFWFCGVIMLFCAAVYGDFEILVDSVRKKEIQRELGRVAENIALSAERGAEKSWQEVKKYEHELAGKIETEAKKGLKWVKYGLGYQENASVVRQGTVIQADYNAGKRVFQARLGFAPQSPAYKWFILKDPARLVVDFPGKWKQEIRRKQVFAGSPIRKIIYGRHADYFRMVLYYREDISLHKQDPMLEREKESISLRVTKGQNGAHSM